VLCPVLTLVFSAALFPSTPAPLRYGVREMLDALRGEGLIQLGLSALQYRQLAALREAAATLSPDLDALKYDR